MAASPGDIPLPRLDGETVRFDVPAGWRQGRGTFGGLVVGAAVRAIELVVADPRRLVRSVTAELAAPVEAGPSEIAVDILRRGSSVTIARAALRQAGETRAHAVAILAASRPAAAQLSWRDLEPPRAPPWREVEPAPTLESASGGLFPEFARYFEYRVVEGLPLSGGAARTVGWVRPRAPGGPCDAGYMATVVDAWYPAALVRVRAPRPMATIAFTLDLVGELDGLDPEAPLLYRGTAPICGGGYFLETRELWGEDGRLIAYNQQTFAIIA